MFVESDYDKRNNEKKILAKNTQERKIVKIGEIRITKVGLNIGNEINKDGGFIRPFLVLKTGLGGDLIHGVFLTTKYREQFAYQYMEIQNRKKYGLQHPSYAIINQAKVISYHRRVRLCNNIIVNEIHIPLVDLTLCDIIRSKIINFLNI